MSEEEQDNLKFQLAQALFSAEVPFAFVENLLVIQFFKCLWPSFKLPNRRKLARNLLNDVYDEVKLQTNEQISKAKTLCIVSDVSCISSSKIKNVFKSLQKSKTALEQTLIMDPDIRKKINNTVRNFVLSENFWDMLDTIIKFLEPIVIALKLFESDTSTFSTVYFHSKKLMHQVSEISCNFSNNIQQLVQKRWDYIYHPVMMAAYMLNSCFLEKSKNTDIEAMGYREFTEFTSKRFGQEESVIMFTELWQFWPNSSLQQLAIKILSIPTSFAIAERNFFTFGFIHNKICNLLQNKRVKKLIYIYRNLQLYEKELKRKLIHDRRNDNNNNDINNNNNNTGNDNNDNDDNKIFRLELNITDLATE
ncbi:unnamed protein product [Rhizophagus irregularis]|nr:unnamed protein product [Rhizophagus irregularis]